MQHFKGVGLARRCTGLPVLLDHLVDLRVLVEPLHCKVRAGAAAGWRDEDGGQQRRSDSPKSHVPPTRSAERRAFIGKRK